MESLLAGLIAACLTFMLEGFEGASATIITNGLIAVCAAHLNEIRRIKR